MATFTIEITDDAHLRGIAAARQEYNNSLSPSMDENGQEVPNAGILLTDQEYVQFVMSRAAESYSRQYPV